ncbi:MAG: DUF2254 domain-containing protein [Spartobacteria bacterium]
MKTFFSTWWERLSTSYWFFPSLLALSSIAFSILTLHIDNSIKPEWARNTAWVWAGGAEGARNVLATIASSTMTVAGVVFSITIVTLTLASSQFGPRLLRNFMNDIGTQFALGIFVATYLYCLLVLRAIRGTDQITVVPFFSVTCGIVLAVTSVGFLIYFIHHISSSIVAENVIGRVANDLQGDIDRLYPESMGNGEDESEKAEEVPADFEKNALPIESHESGFIQAIAIDNLLELTEKKKLVLRLRRRPGQFIAEGAHLADVVFQDGNENFVISEIRKHFFFGRHRTPTQDIEYSIDQLVEVALRALSPGINDPFTAITCIEWLGASLIRVAERRMPSRWRYDKKGQLRIITDVTDFEGIANAALNQLRQYGCKSVAVTIRLLEVLTRIGPHIVRPGDWRTLLEHAGKLRDDGVGAAVNEQDRQQIEKTFARTRAALTPSDR